MPLYYWIHIVGIRLKFNRAFQLSERELGMREIDAAYCLDADIIAWV